MYDLIGSILRKLYFLFLLKIISFYNELSLNIKKKKKHIKSIAIELK
jgi:hypothetical protein